MTELLQRRSHDLDANADMRLLVAAASADELPYLMNRLYRHQDRALFYAVAARTIDDHFTQPSLSQERPPSTHDALEAFMAYTYLWKNCALELAGLTKAYNTISSGNHSSVEDALLGAKNELLFYSLFAGASAGSNRGREVLVMAPSSAADDYHGSKNAIDMRLRVFAPIRTPRNFAVQLKTSLTFDRIQDEGIHGQYNLNNVIILSPDLFAPYLPNYLQNAQNLDTEVTHYTFAPYKNALHNTVSLLDDWANGHFTPAQAHHSILQNAKQLRPLAPAFLQYAQDRPDRRILERYVQQSAMV